MSYTLSTYLIVELAKVHAVGAPRCEMGANVDGTANTLVLTDLPSQY